jgi:phosphopantetheine adenylyltransferase
MARDPVLFERQKQKVISYYQRWDSLKEFGVKKHTNAWCIAKAADYFGLTPSTVSNYLYR